MKQSAKGLSVAFLFDDTLDSTAGVSQYVRTVGGWLSRQGHNVTYLVGDTKMKNWVGAEVYSLSKNLKVKFNSNILSTPMPTTSGKSLSAIIDRKKFDVVHVQVPYSPFMAQRVIRRLPDRTAVVGTFHILPSGRAADYGTRALRTVYGRSLKRFDTMLAVSPAAAAFAQATLGVEATVLPNAVDIANFNRTTKHQSVSATPKRIVFLGRLVDRKGAKQLLLAFKLLIKKLPDCQLVIAGAGPQSRELKAYVHSHKLESKVEMPGFIDEDKKADLLSGAGVACFPSLYGESFGISLLEAMATGGGVVLGGDNPGYRSVLGDQPLLLIDPRDSQKFADRLERLLTDQPLIAELRDWQAEHVKQFDVAIVAPKIVAVYRAAIAKRRTDR